MSMAAIRSDDVARATQATEAEFLKLVVRETEFIPSFAV